MLNAETTHSLLQEGRGPCKTQEAQKLPKKKITRPLPLKHQTTAEEQRLFGKAVYTLGQQEAPGRHFMSCHSS